MASTRLREIHTHPTADAFNEHVPVGTAVRYFPIRGYFSHLETRTRSKAWALGSGQVVVMVDGKSGGVAIDHLVVIEDGEALEQLERMVAETRRQGTKIERFGAVLGKLTAIVSTSAEAWQEDPRMRGQLVELLAEIAAIDEEVGDGGN